MLTTTQKKRAAKEARHLASLIVEGRAPKMNAGDWTLCACGWVARAIGVTREWNVHGKEVRAADGRLIEETAWPRSNYYGTPMEDALVSKGLELHGPDGAVFPLLALADALEAA